jgi:hypothetical protein
MRARFLSRFEWAGKDVYSYDDLDTGEVVYLEGGRSGEELKRFTPIDYPPIHDRAIDIMPQKDIFQFILQSYNTKDPYRDYRSHDHWAIKED